MTGLVRKSANLTIHVILDQIERYKKKHRRFPRKLYMQVDGGAENANSDVIAYMEYLVVLRIIPEIYITRLPVGHTHEDIDAMFGVLWMSFRLKPCLTLNAYKQCILDCFSGDKSVEADCEDIYIIPDYAKFIAPHCDPLSRWAKEQLTVHQIHISICRESCYFPHGYFLQYRDYVSERVIELKAVEKTSAVTFTGHLTGIEPVTHHSKWFPDEDTYASENRPVAGIFNLKRIPYTDRIKGIRPINFISDDITALEAVKQSIVSSKLFPALSPDREEWICWFTSILPAKKSVSGEDYIQTHCYKQPLREYLSGAKFISVDDSIIEDLESLRTKFDSKLSSFEWPRDLVSFATPHVNLVKWKNLIIPPRQYKYLSEYVQQLTKTFETATVDYYRKNILQNSVEKLIAILSRRLNIQGKHDALNGNKENLISRIFTGDYEMFTKFYHPIRDKNLEALLLAYWNDASGDNSDEIKTESELKAESRRGQIEYTMSRALNDSAGNKIDSTTFLKLLSLLKGRESAKKKAYDEFYKTNEGSRQYRESIFLSPPFGTNFFILNDFAEADLFKFASIEDETIHRIYIPVKSDDVLIVLNVEEKEFWYFNANSTITSYDDAHDRGTRYDSLLSFAVPVELKPA